MSLSKTLYPLLSTGTTTRKTRPVMTEKLFDVKNQNKQNTIRLSNSLGPYPA